MKKELRTVLTLLCVLLLAVFVIFVINQTETAVRLAERVSPLLGDFVLYTLIVIYAAAALVPVYLLTRQPKLLTRPADDRSSEFAAYQQKLIMRLAKNRLLHEKGIMVRSEDEAESAVKMLDEAANEEIKKAASTIFLSTAISQSGRLDGLMVLAAHVRLVWKTAHIYTQRPGLREMLSLYTNVAATVFLVTEIEDMDIAEQVEPVISAVLGPAAVSTIPVVGQAASIVTNSLMDGAVNAFLTLRIGIITRQYISGASRSRSAVRRSASIQAAPMLGQITLRLGGKVSKAVMKSAAKPVQKAAKGISNVSKHSADKVKRFFTRGGNKKDGEGKQA